MMSAHADIDRQVARYVRVFVVLVVLTVVTVAVSYLDLPFGATVALGLLVASLKAGLVACCFMHFLSEKRLILWIMTLTAVLLLFALLVPWITESTNIHVAG